MTAKPRVMPVATSICGPLDAPCMPSYVYPGAGSNLWWGIVDNWKGACRSNGNRCRTRDQTSMRDSISARLAVPFGVLALRRRATKIPGSGLPCFEAMRLTHGKLKWRISWAPFNTMKFLCKDERTRRSIERSAVHASNTHESIDWQRPGLFSRVYRLLHHHQTDPSDWWGRYRMDPANQYSRSNPVCTRRGVNEDTKEVKEGGWECTCEA